MQQPVFFTAGDTGALRHARNFLQQWGQTVSSVPGDHVTHLLLPVPSFERSGILKGGQPLDRLLNHLPEHIHIYGGNLPPLPYRCIDFLQDEFYLGENAQITAQCAVKILPQPLDGTAVLVIGWGRIGKGLVTLLHDQRADVTVAVRKEADLRKLEQMGEQVTRISQWVPSRYKVIINTAPAPVLDESQADPHAFLLDLASVRGIAAGRAVWARGLPNQDMPEASGRLIAKTALRYAIGKEFL